MTSPADDPLDLDSEGIYFISVDDFERRSPPVSPERPTAGSAASQPRPPRLRPVAPSEGSDAGGPPNILGTIAHHPHLLEPSLAFAATLATRGVLPRRVSELLALRAAWNCRSAFEWGHHVLFARSAGLEEAEIDDIAAGPGAPRWSDGDRLLLRAADELHQSQDLTDATWDALAREWNEAQLVEIPFVVGQYTMLSMVANATGVPLEKDLPALPGPP